MYKVIVAPRAIKDLEDSPADIRTAVIEAVESLASDPRPPGVKKLAGEAAGSYRIRVRGWRVLYDIDDGARVVLVTRIGPRNSVYR